MPHAYVRHWYPGYTLLKWESDDQANELIVTFLIIFYVKIRAILTRVGYTFDAHSRNLLLKMNRQEGYILSG